MCEVSVAEFLYSYARVFGWDAVIMKHSLLRGSLVRVVGVDGDLTVEAARLKFKLYNMLSLADCYLIALANQSTATIATTDRSVKDVNEAPTTLLTSLRICESWLPHYFN